MSEVREHSVFDHADGHFWSVDDTWEEYTKGISPEYLTKYRYFQKNFGDGCIRYERRDR